VFFTIQSTLCNTLYINQWFCLFTNVGIIADLSLDVVEDVSVFEVKSAPGEEITVRIGLHTGSCCAGK